MLIIASGNMVHKLSMIAWDMIDKPDYRYDWALELNDRFKQLITNDDHQPLIHFDQLGRQGRLAIPTPEHYLPLLYTLGLKGSRDVPLF